LFCSFFFSSRRRHTRSKRDWSSDVCSSDLARPRDGRVVIGGGIALGPRHGRRIIVGTGSLVGGGRALVLGVGGRFFLRCRVALQVGRSGRSVLVDVMHACSPFSGAGPPSRKSVFVLERVVGVTLQQVADG